MQAKAEAILMATISTTTDLERHGPTTFCVVWSRKTGTMYPGISGTPLPKDKVDDRLWKAAENAGVYGEKSGSEEDGKEGNVVGACAEFMAANRVLIQDKAQTTLDDLCFSDAVQEVRGGVVVIENCGNCRKMFPTLKC